MSDLKTFRYLTTLQWCLLGWDGGKEIKRLSPSFSSVLIMNKKYWRCNVCNDVHFGMAGPETCPTCQAKNAYVEIDTTEAKKVMGS